jgi:hypothetical protein
LLSGRSISRDPLGDPHFIVGLAHLGAGHERALLTSIERQLVTKPAMQENFIKRTIDFVMERMKMGIQDRVE